MQLEVSDVSRIYLEKVDKVEHKLSIDFSRHELILTE